MLISKNWLQKYIPDFTVGSPNTLRHRVDTRLSEVGQITPKGEGLSQLVVGRVVSAEKHPDSDHLHVCQVDLGEAHGTSQIVCGAPNVRPDLVSVICMPGGSVYHPETGEVVEITARPVRGVESAGMICSTAELGMNDIHQTIIELPADSIVGEDVSKQFTDVIIEIENKAFPHRPDVFSHMGMAREFGAIFKLDFHRPETRLKFNSRAESILPLEVELRDRDNCKRFSAITISNAKIQPSPLWLQIALSYAGVRPINNVVDVTNYVMLDIGQPMHAFDYNLINAHKLIVRKAKPEEELTTLDQKARKLDESITVVADSKSAQSVAGIMGGVATEISDQTTNMILEAANWEMYATRRASRSLGLRSEASTRYEKGMSASLTVDSLVLAANMLADLADAEVSSDIIDVYPQPEEERIIRLNPKLVSRRLGIQITKQELLDILTPLGITVTNPEQISADIFSKAEVDTEIEMSIPVVRRDLTIANDILEEIARFHGYENVVPTLPRRDLAPAEVNTHIRQTREIQQRLAAAGFYEIITYSMIGSELYQKSLLSSRGLLNIQSPISPELAYVRDTLVPSLLEKAHTNLQKYQNFGLFEISRVALQQVDPHTDLPQQPHHVGAVYTHQTDELAYRHLKAGIEVLSQFTHAAIRINPRHDNLPPFLHPAKSGEVLLGDKYVGFVGVIHPQVAENFGFKSASVAVYELDLDAILSYIPQKTEFKPISRFPAVIRDLSFWQKPDTSVSDLIDRITTSNLDWLESVNIIDTFTKEGKASVAIRLTLQPTTQTLTHEEIDAVVEQVNQLAVELGYTLRG